MEKLSPNRAQLFLCALRNTVFTMGGTVALKSVNKTAAKELICQH